MQLLNIYKGNDPMNSINDIWDAIIGVLSEQLTKTSINTWFSECTPVAIDEGKFVIHTTSKFKRDIIMTRYNDIICGILQDLFSSEFELVVLAEDEINDYRAEEKEKNTLPILDGYTFDNFIVGKCNQHAHAAALSVASNPGSRTYNPLFIYGNSGLGKTHLLFAIGSEIYSKNPKTRIEYVKGDDFTNEMVRSIREGKNEEFRNKYRNADLLLVDDIQFISGKEATQEEFFHTFNNIYEAGHQIVITSDRPPMDMPRLEDRLRTRFESGMLVDVQAPDIETRMAIIRNKAGQLGMRLPDNIVQYIAESIKNNIRQIQGVVNQLTAYRDIDGDITIDIVNRAMKHVIRVGTFVPTPDIIIDETARYYSIDPADIKGQRRSKNIAIARHVSIYLIRSLINMPLNSIGSVFEDRNHATILASIHKIEDMLKSDPEMNTTIRDITSNINSRQR